MAQSTHKKIPYGKRFLSAHDLPGKTLIVQVEGRRIPVLCYDTNGEHLFGLQIRDKRDGDSFPSNWIVGIGDHGLLSESVAMVAKRKVFQMQEGVRILGVVPPQALAAAQKKRGFYDDRPAMLQERTRISQSIAKERRKGHKTKGLNKQLKKLDRALNGPQRPKAGKSPGPIQYNPANPRPMQGGACTPK